MTPENIRETISARILEISRESRQFSLEIQITQTKLKAVVNALMGIVERRGAFRVKERFIHVANGVIRFADDGDVQFGGFSPEDYSRNQSPYAFDQEAECPRFLNELIYPAVPEDDADLIQRWAGLALFGYNLPQWFLILDGMPNGGKGTLVRIIQALVGVENTHQLRTECLHERFETYRFRGKTLLIGPDVPGDFLMRKGASMLKVLVGGDPISAEGKGLNGDFAMFGTFNIVMTCNSRLRIRLEEDAGAWRRRLLVVRYEKPPPANRYCNPEYVKVLSNLSGWQKRAWFDGDWDIAAGQFFTTFRREAHVIDEFDDTRAREWFVAFDYGFTHYTVALLGCTDGDGNVFVVEEHAERLWLPQRHAQAIKTMLARQKIGDRKLEISDLKRFVAGADVFSKQSDGTTVAAQYARLGIRLTCANTERVNGWAEILQRLGDVEAGIRPTLFIHRRCGRLLECLPTLQHDPNRPEDVLKVDADEDGVGGDDTADALRYLVATRTRSVTQRKLSGV